jgi:TolB-like protein
MARGFMRTAGTLALLVYFTCSPLSAAASDGKATPAILMLSFDTGEKDPRGELIADLLTVRLAERFPLVERTALKKILAEHELSLRGLVQPEEVVKLGKLVGARFLVTGRVLPLAENTLLIVRLIDIETSGLRGLNLPCHGHPPPDQIVERLALALTRDLPRWQQELRTPATAPPPASSELPALSGPPITVLNFTNLGQADRRWDWLGKGLADLTIGHLASQALRVVSREQMQEMTREVALKQPRAQPSEVARALRATYCVTGQFGVEGGKLRLHATIQNTLTGKQLHTASVSGRRDDLIPLAKKLSAELVDVFKGNRPGTCNAAHLPQWTDSLPATQLLYEGIDLFDRGQYLDAWTLFRRALRQDPRYADARYWSGRMMYYLQEYHQSRLDLEDFAVEFPRHPRVGDAVMEIVNGVQLLAENPHEVLDVLAFASHLAPRAEVHNQFGTGNSSIVALYAAGLAGQILVDQGRYREAFAWYKEALGHIPVKHPLYQVTWKELFGLKLKQLRTSGELLTLPPTPNPRDWLSSEEAAQAYGPPGRKHPVNLGADVGEPLFQEFVRLTPEQPSVDFDFSQEPCVPIIRDRDTRARGSTYMRQFYSDPEHYLTQLDIEVRYRFDPKAPFRIYFMGAGLKDMNASGVLKHSLRLRGRTRVHSLWIEIVEKNATARRPTTAAILGFKVTAQFAPCKGPPGTLVLHGPSNLTPTFFLDRDQVTFAGGHGKLENVPPGPHTLTATIHNPGSAEAKLDFHLAPEETIDLALYTSVDPWQPLRENSSLWSSRRLTAPYEVFRMGPRMGAWAGLNPGHVRFFEDRQGHWLVLWGLRRDLYLIKSTDRGRTWSMARRLPPPVNTAHDEVLPTLNQDRDGRYLLAFASDRNQARYHAMYVCWSYDLVNFSAPVMVAPIPAEPLRLLQHTDGTYRAYFYAVGRGGSRALKPGTSWGMTEGDRWVVCTSSDLVHWSPPCVIARPSMGLDVTESGGRYALLTTPTIDDDIRVSWVKARFSDDGLTFSEPRQVAYQYTLTKKRGRKDELQRFRPTRIILRTQGGKMLAWIGDGGLAVLLANTGEEAWQQIGQMPDMDNGGGLGAGDYGFDKEGIYYFGVPPDSTLAQQARGFSGGRYDVENQPVFMLRHDFAWQGAPVPERMPAAAELRILKRQASGRSASLKGAGGKGAVIQP